MTPDPAPPRRAVALLRRYSPAWRLEEAEGDLEELFHRRVRDRGRRHARLLYWKEVLLFCLWHAHRPTYHHARGPVMLASYLKIALRSLRRHAGYATINVAGLALGIACCLLLLTLVGHEYAYDGFHVHGDRLHRVLVSIQGEDVDYAMPPVMGPALEEDLPGIERAVRFVSGQVTMRHGRDVLAATALFADPAFLEVFTFPLRTGDPADALADPGRVVLSAATARTHFGDADPVGRTLTLSMGGYTLDLIISGVLAPLPTNSSLSFDVLLSHDVMAQVRAPGYLTDWDTFEVNTFVLLRETGTAAAVEDGLQGFVENRLGALLSEQGLVPSDLRLFLQPYAAYHLGPYRGGNGLASPRRPSDLYILAGIALTILLIACFNFTSLSLGRLSARYREAGVRKVLGAGRGQLVRQYLLEALLVSGLALGLGLVITRAGLPAFSGLVGRSLALDALMDARALPVLATLLVGVTLAAGGYPALVLARFSPMQVLSAGGPRGGRSRFTRALVVIQFTLSTGLIIVTLHATGQLRYVAERDLGFDPERIVTVSTRSVSAEDVERLLETFRSRLTGRDGIERVAGASSAFAGGMASTTAHHGDDEILLAHFRVVPGFLETMGMDLVAGRTFSEDRPTDASEAVLVNEAFVRAFGLDDPVGRTFDHESGVIPPNPVIIGVVRDVHYRSLHNEVGPMALYLNPGMPLAALQVRVRPEASTAALDAMRATWTSLHPDQPFAYAFLDEAIGRRYAADRNWARIFSAATVLAIVIAGLGLFALSAFTAERRTREIGIRKALGATAPGLALLLTRDVLLLVTLGLALAAPLAYLAADRLLQAYAYRIDLSPTTFLMAGLITVGIAALAASYQSITTALTNPAHTLRHE